MSSPTPNVDIIISTFILSKKWNQLWLSVLTLDFDDQGSPNFLAFRHFVYLVMLMRDASLPIRSFLQRCDPYDINRFISVAVKRGIDNLTLDLSGTDDDFQIRLDPIISTVFNCRNLVVLKLKSLKMYICPQLDFPLLKTLHLDKVYFYAFSGSRFNKLIEACPILEQLQVTDLQFGSPITTMDTYQQVYSCHNLIHIELTFIQLYQKKVKNLVELLQHCPKLQDLTLQKLYERQRDEHDWGEPQTVPKCLSSQLRTCSLIGYKGSNCELLFAEYILKNAKVLQTMKISTSSSVLHKKHHMLMKLSVFKGFFACKLLFD
ncbi:F-box/RNI/FBD-like domain protein [Medicago truncatula]|uniref:F-box/RNI/FBD-like domain protein n=1 Tax=Medicago truncatula TaxID=3880 RepID=G7JXD0_MEDTR|nr:F-box/RNI/FBD-like domain protein [Medicago truncatula]